MISIICSGNEITLHKINIESQFSFITVSRKRHKLVVLIQRW